MPIGISHQIDPTPKGKEGATDSLIVLGSLVPEGSEDPGERREDRRPKREGGRAKRDGERTREPRGEKGGFQREGFQGRFPQEGFTGRVSRGRVPREGFQREGSQEAFPERGVPVCGLLASPLIIRERR